MSFNISLYRKYRPKTFSEVYGQEFVIKTLKNSIINNKLSHAYILSGSRGIGKTSIAKIFAKAVNCLDNNNGDCCNKCKNCLSINNNSTLDVVEIDAASNNGVADIRLIIENINYLPSSLNYKVYIIDETHMLTSGAWNALLKTIEDPPKHLIFIFATTEPNKIPLTIISRCQKFNLYNLSLFELENIIKNICDIENIKIENNAIKKLAYIADGSVRDCLTFLGQIDTYTNSNITMEDINQVFGLLDLDKKIEFIKNIIECKFERIIQTVKDLEFKGIDFYQLGLEIVEILFDKLIYEKTNNISLLKILSKLNIGLINIESKELIKLIEIWQDGLFKMKINSNMKFYFELTCLNATKLFDFESTSINNFTQQNIVKNIAINESKKEEKTLALEAIKLDQKEIKNEISSTKKLTDNEFQSVNFDDIVVKKIYGNVNQANNVSYVKFDNNKVENNSLEKLDAYSDNVVRKGSEIDFFEDKISTPLSLDVTEIIKNSILTKPFVIENNKDANQSKPKENKTKEIVEVAQKDDQEFNLFNFETSSFEESKNLNYEKEIEIATNVESSSINNGKQKIIDDFKSNLKSIAMTTSSIKKIFDDNKPALLKTANISIKEYSNQDKINIFLQIADNNDNNIKVKIINILATIKGKIAKSLEEGYFVNADKILLASNNGIVILFDDEIACKNLNSNSNNTNFLKYIKEKFKNVYLFLALTKKEAQEYTKIYKNHLNTNTKLEDINIDELLDKIDKKDTIKDLAINMLGDVIEEEK